jgi:hypothetical protein
MRGHLQALPQGWPYLGLLPETAAAAPMAARGREKMPLNKPVGRKL